MGYGETSSVFQRIHSTITGNEWDTGKRVALRARALPARIKRQKGIPEVGFDPTSSEL